MWISRLLPLAFGMLALALPCGAQTASGIHIEAVTLHDYGSDEAAILALPIQPPKAAALLLPDALGSRAVVEQRCVLLARMGYLALALDLYDGQETTDPAEAARLAQRLDSARAGKAILAAFRLLLDSPRYRSSSVLIAAWDPHIPHLAEALDQQPERLSHIPLLSVIEAGTGSLGILQNRPWPLQFIVRTAGAPARRPASSAPGILPYNLFDAPAGFMLDASDPPAAVEAWSLMLDAWNRRLEGQPVAPLAPLPSPAAPAADTLETQPATPASPPARPPSKPLHPRLAR